MLAQSLAALRVLAWSTKPLPRRDLPVAVAHELDGAGYIATTYRPSPYNSDRGRVIAHVEATDAGRAVAPAPGPGWGPG